MSEQNQVNQNNIKTNTTQTQNNSTTDEKAKRKKKIKLKKLMKKELLLEELKSLIGDYVRVLNEDNIEYAKYILKQRVSLENKIKMINKYIFKNNVLPVDLNIDENKKLVKKVVKLLKDIP